MKETIGWGILGLGRIANDFATSLRELPDARVAAAGSRDIEKSRKFCELYGGKPYGSYEEMANDPDVDIIYVATPHNYHEEHVLLCVNAGKNVLCEKPFAINAAQAQRMYDAAREKNVLLMDGLWSRYFPAWEFATDYIKKGEMGKILAINSATCWGFDARVNRDPKGRLFDINLAGGALLDAGVYSLAVSTLLLGDDVYPKTINAFSQMGKSGVDEMDLISMQYDSGVLFTMICGLPGNLHETHILLEGGTITIPEHRKPETVIISGRQRADDWRYSMSRSYHFPYPTEGFQYEAAHAHDCLRKGLKTSPRVTPKESLILMRICDEVRRQASFTYPFE
ncbi:MAG: Gfo/Idh/MocA family oxidoreductase [Oscillospiraceae bacterium]|jgi:predicted dehydrogenase|nr:Gfo/Idh/MocA family oxidoreductase [Oscillospiraceae bacterium]